MNTFDFDRIPSMDESEWDYFSREQKLAALQNLENELAKDQNRTACHIRAEELPLNIRGETDPATNGIIVNSLDLDHHKTPRVLINTVAHEGRHAQQDDCFINPDRHPELSEATKRNIAHNLANDGYCPHDQDRELYKKQFVEVDARRFAAQVLQDYDTHQARKRTQAPDPDPAPPANDEWERNILQNMQETDQRQAKPLSAKGLAEQEAKKKSVTMGL